jgi:hypothetical protein
MKLLLPVLCAGLAFAATRYAGVHRENAAHPASGGGGDMTAAATAPTRRPGGPVKPRGLQRRIQRLREMDRASLTTLDRMFRAGRFNRGRHLDLPTMVEQCARADPMGTWEWVEENLVKDGPDSNYDYCISRAIVPLFFEDPEFALKKLKVLKASGWDGEVLHKLLWKLWSEDSRESALVIRYGQQLFEVVKDWMDPSTLEFKFNVAPQGREALNTEEAFALPGGGELRDATIRDTFSQWLADDPRPAFSWMKSHLPPDQQEMIMESFAEKMFKHTDGEKPNELDALVGDWISREAPPLVRARVGPNYAKWLATTGGDPEAAFQWAGNHLSSAPLAAALRNVVPAYVRKDPEAARRAIESLPPGHLRREAEKAIKR